jgi:hypothetical protein
MAAVIVAAWVTVTVDRFKFVLRVALAQTSKVTGLITSIIHNEMCSGHMRERDQYDVLITVP